MKESTVAFRETLAGRIRDPLARKKGVEGRKMFGGIGFLLNGDLLDGVRKDSPILRLGPEDGEEGRLEPHVRAFDFTGTPMKGWVVVEPEGVEEDGQLKAWIVRATKFVRPLPGR